MLPAFDMGELETLHNCGDRIETMTLISAENPHPELRKKRMTW